MLETSHVLLSLQAAPQRVFDDEDDDEIEEEDATTPEYKELCKRLGETPEHRVKDFTIALVTDSILKRKVFESSQFAPTTFPGYLLYRYNLKLPSFLLGSDDEGPPPPVYPEYVLYQQGSFEKGGLRYVQHKKANADGEAPEEAVTGLADHLSTFVATYLQRQKIGNYVYSIATFDIVASQVMETADRPALQWVWVKLIGPLARYWMQPQQPLFNMMSFEQELADVYLKAAVRILEGGTGQVDTQIKRLESILAPPEDDDEKPVYLSPSQREKIGQKLYIWKRFAEPPFISPEELKNFWFRMGLNLMTLLCIIMLLPMFLMGSYEEVEEYEEEKVNEKDDPSPEEEEPMEPEPIESEASPTKAKSKKELRIEAMQRAKESMKADQDKVKAVREKRKAQEGPSESTSSKTQEYYGGLKVDDLRALLREKNLKVSGKKADLIQRLLDAE